MQSIYRTPCNELNLAAVSALQTNGAITPRWLKRPPVEIGISRGDGSTAAKSLLLLDLDNTLTDTRRWFADSILELTAELSAALSSDTDAVNKLFANVASATTLHEYAYVVEVIASRLKAHRSLQSRHLMAVGHAFWRKFSERHRSIELYDGVLETLRNLRRHHPALKIIILTDSPEWIALERMSLVGILPLIDGVAAIRTETPSLRHRVYADSIRQSQQRVEAKLAEVNTNHFRLNLRIPAAFAKPSSAGIELITQRLGLTEGQIIICGDKDSKEGRAAVNWRKRKAPTDHGLNGIHYVRAHYGNHDLADQRYHELAQHIPSLQAPAPADHSQIPVACSLDAFEQITHVVDELLAERPLSKTL